MLVDVNTNMEIDSSVGLLKVSSQDLHLANTPITKKWIMDTFGTFTLVRVCELLQWLTYYDKNILNNRVENLILKQCHFK